MSKSPLRRAGRFKPGLRSRVVPALYYSLMDWHHPDGARCAQPRRPGPLSASLNTRKGLIREIMTNIRKKWTCFGTARGLALRNAQGWEFHSRMNTMVFRPFGASRPDLTVKTIAMRFFPPRGKFFSSAGTEDCCRTKLPRPGNPCKDPQESWGYQHQ